MKVDSIKPRLLFPPCNLCFLKSFPFLGFFYIHIHHLYTKSEKMLVNKSNKLKQQILCTTLNQQMLYTVLKMNHYDQSVIAQTNI